MFALIIVLPMIIKTVLIKVALPKPQDLVQALSHLLHSKTYNMDNRAINVSVNLGANNRAPYNSQYQQPQGEQYQQYQPPQPSYPRPPQMMNQYHPPAIPQPVIIQQAQPVIIQQTKTEKKVTPVTRIPKGSKPCIASCALCGKVRIFCFMFFMI